MPEPLSSLSSRSIPKSYNQPNRVHPTQLGTPPSHNANGKVIVDRRLVDRGMYSAEQQLRRLIAAFHFAVVLHTQAHHEVHPPSVYEMFSTTHVPSLRLITPSQHGGPRQLIILPLVVCDIPGQPSPVCWPLSERKSKHSTTLVVVCYV